jgi:ubiquinone/menaquinone biosynthesis C-methylase UbiE
MDWHDRYVHQARWTRDLRRYLFDKAGLNSAQRILEVGCGTGAILTELVPPSARHGLDLDRAALLRARVHAPGAFLANADALRLPYAGYAFDIAFCHFLLLWVSDPLQVIREMARVTRPNGFVIALAEPDHTARVDKPDSLAPLGQWQTEALRAQGADVAFGARLADTFDRAGIEIVETGALQSVGGEASREAREDEWRTIETDLAASVPGEDLRTMKALDEQAWERGERVLFVPTYFVLGRV